VKHRSQLGPVLLALFAALLPAGLTAQRVVLAGRGPIETDTVLERIARTPGWIILSRDTTIEPGQTLSGPVLAAGSTVRFAGTISGDLVIVDANVFVRPQARIQGNVINIGGGFFRSNEAEISGELIEYREALYRVALEEDDVVRIVGIETPSVIDLDGFRGITLPTYDRVDGIGVRAGLRWLMPRLGTIDPILHVTGRYAVERERPGGSVELQLRGRSFEAAFGAERSTVTQDDWLRTDFHNSVSFATRGRDYRNYYEADRFFARSSAIWDRSGADFTAGIRVQVEDARSLSLFGDAWTLLDADSIRANPAIDDGRISSLIGSAAVRWDLDAIAGDASLDIETAGKLLGGDFSFGRFELSGTAALSTFGNHTLLLEWRGHGPLPGTDSLPRQRWSILGGRGTLYTEEPGTYRGDRLAYVETEYLIPLPIAEAAPIIGRPALGLVHHVGMAWTHDEKRDLQQNIGLRLRLRLVWFLGMIDPSDTDRHGLFVGIGLPIRYPWWPDTL
jgi:hypothetical protein